jgi:hypothetical protein
MSRCSRCPFVLLSFIRYRIFTQDMQFLIGDDRVFQSYARCDIRSLHEKNLFELEEDNRMLTTLLLQYFPGMRLSFVPEAVCWTTVPHRFWDLLSQRRRWINSTFHNMYELLKVETGCGICFLSMKMVVVTDLIAIMIIPASLVYLGYLAYLFAMEPETIDTFVWIFLVVSFGLQMVSFVLRSRWDYFLWFGIFCVAGIPVLYFFLPLYAFAHMDDFSLGKTRQVGPEGGKKKNDKGDAGSITSQADFSESSSPASPRRSQSKLDCTVDSNALSVPLSIPSSATVTSSVTHEDCRIQSEDSPVIIPGTSYVTSPVRREQLLQEEAAEKGRVSIVPELP